MGWCRGYDDHLEHDEPYLERSPLLQPQAGMLNDALHHSLCSATTQWAATVVRRDVYETVGGFSPTAGHYLDWEMRQRIAFHYPVYYEPAVLAAQRIHDHSVAGWLRFDETPASTCQRVLEMIRAYLPPDAAEKLTELGKQGLVEAIAARLQKALENEQHEAALLYIRELLGLGAASPVIEALLPDDTVSYAVHRALTLPPEIFEEQFCRLGLRVAKLL
jgi:hypothetical protein